ncbi:PLP-dependent cysteine synthase family protein [Pseudovibrio exalbescens]|uniref:PLP-dependent cysteine synthase family protein n=1 Tax=Pseudovibrio exalbescens TaxID=197461 RepID=UPI0023660C0D|nr:PLP-dependent cysteine synthase family protein [Pseudovibrio exalbescens]MDD7910868.1 PLP-dependent cysteine synthase family protein [Pseudovibrio exalbescens]
MTSWRKQAVQLIQADYNRSADTHLFRVDAPALTRVDLYLKDESTHPTGSLKHRLARSLFLHAICNGWIREGKPVIEASSGSTAVSEAYFAKLLGLEFIAVMPATTSQQKIAAIEFYGGTCHLVEDPTTIGAVSQQLADDTGGHFVDQFTYAERATDWRGSNNIAESIFEQMSSERFPVPKWVVMCPGTGGTSATIGRYIRYRCEDTKLLVVDPENSVFYDCYAQERNDLTLTCGSRIEGIGRPRCEKSFVPTVIDEMRQVPDAASIGAMRALEKTLGRRPGGSTGTNFYGVCQLAAEMLARGDEGSIVSLMCDGGERYANTYYNDAWLEEHHIHIRPYEEQVLTFLGTGRWEAL